MDSSTQLNRGRSTSRPRGSTWYSQRKLLTIILFDDDENILSAPQPTISKLTHKKRVIEKIDPEQNQSKVYYDSLGRLVKKIDPLGGTIDYLYNKKGLLETTLVQSDNKILKTKIEYDSLGRRIQISDPNTGKWGYEYDNLDRVISETKYLEESDEIIDIVEYDYKGHELIYERSGNNILIKYEYGNNEFSNSSGRISKVITYNSDADDDSEESSTVFSYDSKGNVSNYITSIDERNFGFSTSYDPQGNITGVTYPDGKVLNYHYADEGHIEAITMDGKSLVEYGIKKEDYGKGVFELIRKTGNGIETIFSYDPAMMRLTNILTRNSNDTDQIFENVSYDYSLSGNIKSMNVGGLFDELPYVESVFEYDELNRLKSATGLYDKIEYDYKGNGNLSQKGDLEMFYENSKLPNAVSRDSAGNNYIYDKKGNLTSYKGKSLTYDIKGQLKSVDYKNKNEKFIYDYAGKRIKTEKDDGTVIYSISGMYELVVMPNEKEVNSKYVFGYNGDPVAKIRDVEKSSAIINFNLFVFRMHNWRSLKGFMLKLYSGASYLAFNKDFYKYFMIVIALTFTMFVFFLWLKVVISSDYGIIGFGKWAFHLSPVILITFFTVFGYTGCFLTDFEGYVTEGIYYFHPDHLSSIKMISDDKGEIIAFNNYTPYGDDASKYKGFKEKTTELKNKLKSLSQRLGQVEREIESLIKRFPYLSKNVENEEDATFLARLKNIEINLSPARSDVNLAGFGVGFDCGTNFTPIVINTDLINKTNLEHLLFEEKLNEIKRTPYNFKTDDYMNKKMKEYAEARERKFEDLQQEASMLRKKVSLLQTMVGEKGTDGITRMKYTSQEHDKDTGLYYYGARYYDPEIGRFIQPDSYIDGMTSTQGWNRYMYVHGNPVRYSDPSGNGFFDFFRVIFSGGSGSKGGSSGGGSGWAFSFGGLFSSLFQGISNYSKGYKNKSNNFSYTHNAKMIPVSDYNSNSSSQISNWSASTNGPAVTGTGGSGIDVIGISPGLSFAELIFNENDLGIIGNLINNQLDGELEKKLFTHYWEGSEEPYCLTEKDFNYISKNGKLIGEREKVSKNIYKQHITTYHDKNINQGIGEATMYFNKNGVPIGLSDYYNFDPKKFGVRKFKFEIQTRSIHYLGKFLNNSKNFKIKYGITE